MSSASQSKADLAYANGAFIAGSAAYPERWAREAAAFRAGLGNRAQLDLAYGPGERQALDLFFPETTPKGLLVFVHGGYWLAFDRKSWSHLAAGAVACGWACAMPSYTLAPTARISAMTKEIARAVEFVSSRISGPVAVTGHSAGGHLSARMGCDDVSFGAPVARVVPISPLADLEPLMATSMNATLHIDAAEAEAESPARRKLRSGCTAHVWVGAEERPSFLWQARTLSEAWGCPWTAAPGYHHFSVIEDLAVPESGLMAACLGG